MFLLGIARERLGATIKLASDALVPVLADEVATEPVPMFAVMLQEWHRLPKVSACIEHMAQWLARIC